MKQLVDYGLRPTILFFSSLSLGEQQVLGGWAYLSNTSLFLNHRSTGDRKAGALQTTHLKQQQSTVFSSSFILARPTLTLVEGDLWLNFKTLYAIGCQIACACCRIQSRPFTSHTDGTHITRCLTENIAEMRLEGASWRSQALSALFYLPQPYLLG